VLAEEALGSVLSFPAEEVGVVGRASFTGIVRIEAFELWSPLTGRGEGAIFDMGGKLVASGFFRSSAISLLLDVLAKGFDGVLLGIGGNSDCGVFFLSPEGA